ncbi:MAG: iron-sulfur cluster assembly scaffold protein [Rubrobacteraceae bacterium]
MDRKARVARLVEHVENPLHKRVLDGAQVVMPDGSPECGGSVTVYLKGDGDGCIEGLSWTGQGDTISMGSTSIALERVLGEDLTMDEVLDFDYEALLQEIGRDVIGSRTRNATMGLSTLKSAVRKYRRNRLADDGQPSKVESV